MSTTHDTDAMKTARLQTVDGHAIPLKSVELGGEVVGAFARMRVRQTYAIEKGGKPVEAIDVFPLPSDATLVGFSMECEGRRVDGVVKEREAAFRAYDDAMVSGHGAALLEQERPNVFTANVGNLLPGEETVVEVTYVQRLLADEGALRLTIPTLVAPRYMPGTPSGDRTAHGTHAPTDRVPDADRISPPIGDVSYRVALDLSLALGDDVEVSSPSHDVQVAREAGRTKVSFRRDEVLLDRDLVLVVERVDEAPFTALVAHRDGDGTGYVALTHVPDLFAAASRNGGAVRSRCARLDVVFLLDRSGSMGGESIVEARRALRLCLRNLREGDRFNVVAFDDREESFAPEPVPFTQKTLEQADAWVASIEPRGGTELLAPLVNAVQAAKNGVVVLLTDGQIGNEDEVLKRVLEVRKGARVYTFGIGTAVSDVLLRNLAKRTGGAVQLIHPGEKIDEKVIAIFAKAIAPRVTEVKVKLEGIDLADFAPGEHADLVDGDPWVLFARYDQPGRGKVVLSGLLAGERWSTEVPVELPDRADVPALAPLWAAERVRDFEAMELTGRRADAMRARIVELATTFGIASKYTSFVVVETRTGDRRATTAAETRVVPVNAPAGWAMFQKPAAPPMQAFARMRMSAPLAGGYGSAGAPPPAPGAMPPPMAMPAPMRAVSSAAPKSSSVTGAIGGFFKSLVGADGGSKDLGALHDEPEMSAAPADAMPMELDEKAEVTRGSAVDPTYAVLAAQLASGLWDDGEPRNDDELRRVRATFRALLTLLRAGVTTAHPLHGEQVRKAIEALVPAAARLASRVPDVAELALAIAFLVASGKRTRKTIADAVKGTPALATLGGQLGDEPALRARVERA